MHAVTCSYPLLHRPVIVSGSQDSPPIEGQFITYTCPTGYILTGPNASICKGNREWEPDPGQVDCIGNYRSRLDRSVELHANAFWEHDVDSTRVNESEVV